MTFMTVSYELQNKLKPEQFRALGMFANTYGLQRFRLDEKIESAAFRLRCITAAGKRGRARPARGENSGAAPRYTSLISISECLRSERSF